MTFLTLVVAYTILDPGHGLLNLMRHEWHLSNEQREYLDRHFAGIPVLETLYEANQQLNRNLLLKTLNAERARRMLPAFLADYRLNDSTHCGWDGIINRIQGIPASPH